MRKRVLVVDDDPLTRDVGRRTLERAGFDVAVAGSVAETLVLLASSSFQVAILDYFLDAGDCGCDLIAPLRASSPTIRIIVLSGLGFLPEVIHHAHRAGAHDVVSKLHADWIAMASSDTDTPSPRPRPAVDLGALKREVIHGAFLVHHRNVTTTARALGINRSSLQRVLRKTPPPLPKDPGESD